ncbi:MAG: hypothetical protein H0V04_07050 [Chloroflexi bacterium]|nr:hypothetical protein [Chloroflexota bacterium]
MTVGESGATVDPARLLALLADEERRFRDLHPRSIALHERARASLARARPDAGGLRTDDPAAEDPELSRYLHLHALNRGVLLTPFHEMALMSPVTSEEDVDQHAAVFEEALADLAG